MLLCPTTIAAIPGPADGGDRVGRVFRSAPPTNLRLTRRALAVTVSGSALALAACDLDPRSTDAGPDDAEAPSDPDLIALADTVAATTEAAALVAATTAAHPDLIARLTGFGDLHTVHQAALAGAVAELREPTASATPPVIAPARPQALAAVRRAETTLARQLAGRAQRAESGTFARLLAVMSAAVQQELTALDQEPAA